MIFSFRCLLARVAHGRAVCGGGLILVVRRNLKMRVRHGFGHQRDLHHLALVGPEKLPRRLFLKNLLFAVIPVKFMICPVADRALVPTRIARVAIQGLILHVIPRMGNWKRDGTCCSWHCFSRFLAADAAALWGLAPLNITPCVVIVDGELLITIQIGIHLIREIAMRPGRDKMPVMVLVNRGYIDLPTSRFQQDNFLFRKCRARFLNGCHCRYLLCLWWELACSLSLLTVYQKTDTMSSVLESNLLLS